MPFPCRLIILFVLAASCFSAETGNLAIVVRNDVPVDNMSFGEVRKLFLGDRQFWTNDLRVTLLVRAPATREREAVLRLIYQMNEAQFRQYWISKVFRAESVSGPKIVYSNEMALELVSAIRGAVAFVNADAAPKTLKVIRIDGHLPGEKGYPLH